MQRRSRNIWNALKVLRRNEFRETYGILTIWLYWIPEPGRILINLRKRVDTGSVASVISVKIQGTEKDPMSLTLSFGSHRLRHGFTWKSNWGHRVQRWDNSMCWRWNVRNLLGLRSKLWWTKCRKIETGWTAYRAFALFVTIPWLMGLIQNLSFAVLENITVLFKWFLFKNKLSLFAQSISARKKIIFYEKISFTVWAGRVLSVTERNSWFFNLT